MLSKQGDIMRRKNLNDLIEWMNDPRRKSLMVWGARQVGKSYVYPVTFDEFLLNYNENKYNYVKNHFENKEPIDKVIHDELIDDFRTYS